MRLAKARTNQKLRYIEQGSLKIITYYCQLFFIEQATINRYYFRVYSPSELCVLRILLLKLWLDVGDYKRLFNF